MSSACCCCIITQVLHHYTASKSTRWKTVPHEARRTAAHLVATIQERITKFLVIACDLACLTVADNAPGMQQGLASVATTSNQGMTCCFHAFLLYINYHRARSLENTPS